MDQRVVGPYFWKLLHGLAHTYKPSRDRARMCRLLRDLQTLFPCRYCRNAYRRKIARDPFAPHLRSRDALARWLIRTHNRVNAQTHRARMPVAEGLRLGARFAKHTAANFALAVACVAHNIRRNTPARARGARTRELLLLVDAFPELWESPWGGRIHLTAAGRVAVSRTPVPRAAILPPRRRGRARARAAESRRTAVVRISCA